MSRRRGRVVATTLQSSSSSPSSPSTSPELDVDVDGEDIATTRRSSSRFFKPSTGNSTEVSTPATSVQGEYEKTSTSKRSLAMSRTRSQSRSDAGGTTLDGEDSSELSEMDEVEVEVDGISDAVTTTRSSQLSNRCVLPTPLPTISIYPPLTVPSPPPATQRVFPIQLSRWQIAINRVLKTGYFDNNVNSSSSSTTRKRAPSPEVVIYVKSSTSNSAANVTSTTDKSKGKKRSKPDDDEDDDDDQTEEDDDFVLSSGGFLTAKQYKRIKDKDEGKGKGRDTGASKRRATKKAASESESEFDQDNNDDDDKPLAQIATATATKTKGKPAARPSKKALMAKSVARSARATLEKVRASKGKKVDVKGKGRKVDTESEKEEADDDDDDDQESEFEVDSELEESEHSAVETPNASDSELSDVDGEIGSVEAGESRRVRSSKQRPRRLAHCAASSTSLIAVVAKIKRSSKKKDHKKSRKGLTWWEKNDLDMQEHHKELTNVWSDLAKLPIITPQKQEQPPGLSLKLLPFQQEGLYWMLQQEKGPWKGGMLADEMGMGKTIREFTVLSARMYICAVF